MLIQQFVFTLITSMIHFVMMKIMCWIAFMMEVTVVKNIHMIHGMTGAIYVNVLRRQMNGLLCHALVMVLVTILKDNATL